MKKIIFCCLLLIAHKLHAQSLIFDKASGDIECSKFGMRAMNLIAMNDAPALMELFEKASGNIKQIEEAVKDASQYVAMAEGVLPPMFKDEKSKRFYYERNVYVTSRKTIILQIHLTIIKSGSRYFIADAAFRKGKEIVKRTKECSQLIATRIGDE